ncbi:hypothetical protein DOTSEDRAFT_164349 [Dothistroma septosporum NZE10]|uniref:Uncharacterized protein n=1 Tax=Dothistroma septosporum (strain NZE10 / CBS 128990) TaxID=675120 RepID=N1Q3B8_DOTSN|nr:hypothetical protein DOTSEDRAFT_164349 [Dothistroma septosporum NZE10]
MLAFEQPLIMEQSRWADAPAEAEQTSIDAPSSSLSAAATTFAPDLSAPPPDVTTADMFAQTGAAQDDLFDDIEPIEESMRIRSDDDLFSDDFTPAPQPVVETPDAVVARGGKGNRATARGRGRARGHSENRDSSNRGGHGNPNRPSESPKARDDRPTPRLQPQTSAPENAPCAPRNESTPSVRGDRRATGGLRKPKLTEEELVEKMARISIKNASLTAAHARAEADAASFAEREQQAKHVTDQRRKEERKDRQQMMGEREKNRQRKLKAMEGREWDAEKRDDDFGKGGRYDKKGSFAGDQDDYSDGREYLYRERRGTDRGHGHGGRGARGGRAQNVGAPRPEDFPSLPDGTKSKGTSAQPLASTTLGSSAQQSWADQVEAAPTS